MSVSDKILISNLLSLSSLSLSLSLSQYGDREAAELWSQLQRRIPAMFGGITVQPSLLHGDLWSGNAGQVDTTPGPSTSLIRLCVCTTVSAAVAYDPASFYGHHEFDLAITTMFGGFSQDFYSAYHDLIPRAEGFVARSQLYLLFHYLNHWYYTLFYVAVILVACMQATVVKVLLFSYRNHFGSSYRSQSIAIMKKLVHTR